MFKKLIKYILFLSLFSISYPGYGQDRHAIYWVQFADKDNTPYSLDRPQDYLSQRAIDRRNRHGISLTIEDLPVDPAYLDSLSQFNIKIISTSKWFNGVIAELQDSSLLPILEDLLFVAGSPLMLKPYIKQGFEKMAESKLDLGNGNEVPEYGPSLNQLEMLDGDALHTYGYRGQGMLIAILDAGFTNADKISSLQHIWKEGRVLATRNFVYDQLDLLNSHSHGTKIFSIIGGVEKDILYGSAPEAEFILIRTEDGASEYLVEEYYWICGAEFADSLGADIINSSLGYSSFDDSVQDHTYADMDGASAPISVAANIASSKGMLVVTSAGNQGTSDWHYITAPADADNILSVGAVDPGGIITSFSSRGPSFDGRIKPDLCAQGYQTISQSPDGTFAYCAGTSCSSPVLAGMAACLWQSRPEKNNQQIMEPLKRSSSYYLWPNEDYGYGIPNFAKAIAMIDSPGAGEKTSNPIISVYPNPVEDDLFIQLSCELKTEFEDVILSITDLSGRVQRTETMVVANGNFVLKLSGLTEMSPGLYQLNLDLDNDVHTVFFSKF